MNLVKLLPISMRTPFWEQLIEALQEELELYRTDRVNPKWDFFDLRKLEESGNREQLLEIAKTFGYKPDLTLNSDISFLRSEVESIPFRIQRRATPLTYNYIFNTIPWSGEVALLYWNGVRLIRTLDAAFLDFIENTPKPIAIKGSTLPGFLQESLSLDFTPTLYLDSDNFPWTLDQSRSRISTSHILVEYTANQIIKDASGQDALITKKYLDYLWSSVNANRKVTDTPHIALQLSARTDRSGVYNIFENAPKPKAFLGFEGVVADYLEDTAATLVNYGPIARYPLDALINGSEFEDITGNGHTATSTNVSVNGYGLVGRSAGFNGTDSLIDFGDQAFPALEEGGTFSLWFYAFTIAESTNSSDASEICYQSGQFAISINHYSQRIQVEGQDGYWTTLITGTTVATTYEWYHVAVSYDGDNLRLFVNGVEEGVRAISLPALPSGATFYVGRGPDAVFFEGLIDEVRVYDYPLTGSEIRGLFYEPSTHNEYFVEGPTGKSLALSGKRAADLPTTYTLERDGNYTISWTSLQEIAPPSVTEVSIVESSASPSCIRLEGSMQQVVVQDNLNNAATLDIVPPIPLNQPHRFALTFEASNIDLYVDGIWMDRATYPSGIVTFDTIGESSVADYFGSGWIDDFSIWQKAITEHELLLDARMRGSVVYDDPALYYRFSAGAHDWSTNGNHGALFGFGAKQRFSLDGYLRDSVDGQLLNVEGGTVSYVAGVVAQAVTGAELTFTPALDENTEGAIAFWFRVDGDGGDSLYFFDYISSVANVIFVRTENVSSGTATAYEFGVFDTLTSQSHIIASSPNSLKPDQWQHFVISWSMGKISCYLDSQHVGEISVDPSWSISNQAKRLMVDYGHGMAMQELQMYEHPLSLDEILNLYRRPGSIGSYVEGVVGQALHFNGHRYVDTHDVISASMDGFSIAIWVRLPESAQDQTIYDQSGSSQFRLKKEGETGEYVLESTNAPLHFGTNVSNEWVALCVVYDATQHTLSSYTNGVLFERSSGVGALDAVTPRIGEMRQGGSAPAYGAIDELRIYTRPLGDGEIHALHYHQTTHAKELYRLPGEWIIQSLDDAIIFPHGLAERLFSGPSSFTLLVKAKVDDLSASSRLFEARDTLSLGVQLYLDVTTTSRVRFTISDSHNAGNICLVESSSFVEPNEWFSVGLTYDGETREVKLFINGEDVDSAIDTNTLNRIEYATIGKSPINTVNLRGAIKDFRVYQYVLHQSEIFRYSTDAAEDLDIENYTIPEIKLKAVVTPQYDFEATEYSTMAVGVGSQFVPSNRENDYRFPQDLLYPTQLGNQVYISPIAFENKETVTKGDDVWIRVSEIFRGNSVNDETLAYGDGSTITFNGNLKHYPVRRKKLSISYQSGPNTYTVTDNGAGEITGERASGTVDYETGEYTLITQRSATFTQTLHSGTELVTGDMLAGVDLINTSLSKTPITPGSMLLSFVTGEGNNLYLVPDTDNGDGTGTFNSVGIASASINYATGSINMEFTSTTDDGRDVTIEYIYTSSSIVNDLGRIVAEYETNKDLDITEAGIFDQNGDLVAYSTFPPANLGSKYYYLDMNFLIGDTDSSISEFGDLNSPLNDAMASVTVDLNGNASTDAITNDVILPSSDGAVAFTWTSNNPTYMDNTGQVLQRSLAGHITVEYTVVGNYYGITDSKVITLTLLQDTTLLSAVNAVTPGLNDNSSLDAIESDIALPLSDGAVTFSWSSSEPTYIDNTGTVLRREDDVDVSATLTVTGSYNGHTESKDIDVTLISFPEHSSMTWDTRIVHPWSSDGDQIQLPLVADGTYNFVVDWGDGTSDTITSYDQPEVTHTYATSGVYEIRTTGTLHGFAFKYLTSVTDSHKLLHVESWGTGVNKIRLANTNYQLAATDNLVSLPLPGNAPDLTGVTTFNLIFYDSAMNSSIDHWDVSGVTDMNSAFKGSAYNQPLDSWNVANVVDFSGMFWNSAFDQNLPSWNTSSAEWMTNMFRNASAPKGIETWDVSNVRNFDGMLSFTTLTDFDLSGWVLRDGNISMTKMFEDSILDGTTALFSGVDNVTSMESMFEDATISTDIGINDWVVVSCSSFDRMFYRASLPAGMSINGWQLPVSGGSTTTEYMFYEATLPEGFDLSGWNVGSYAIASHRFMFYGVALPTSLDLSGWNVTQSQYMTSMFQNAVIPSGTDLSAWEPLQARYLNSMFEGAVLEGTLNLDPWNLQNALELEFMFKDTDLMGCGMTGLHWDTPLVQTMRGMFENTPLPESFELRYLDLLSINNSSTGSMVDFLKNTSISHDNYDLTIRRWQWLISNGHWSPAPEGIIVNMGLSRGTDYSQSEKDELINTYNWTIIDDVPDLNSLPSDEILVMTVNTANTDGPGQTTADNQFKLPSGSGGTYDFWVFWGDGEVDLFIENPSHLGVSSTHTYAAPGEYEISIYGQYDGFGWRTGLSDAQKLISITQWGTVKLHAEGGYFAQAQNLVSLPTEAPDLSNTATLEYAFWDAEIFNQDIANWDVSGIQTFDNMFDNATAFNQDLSAWDTSSATSMKEMFRYANAFNSSVGFDTSSVQDFTGMFYAAHNFNHPSVTNWNTSAATTMNSMFSFASSFNQPLNFDTSNVTDMLEMFNGASSFQQSLGGFSISSIPDSFDFGNLVFHDMGRIAYNETLNGWAAQAPNVPSNVVVSFGSSQYTVTGETARETLVSTYGWTISDGGLNIDDQLDVEADKTWLDASQFLNSNTSVSSVDTSPLLFPSVGPNGSSITWDESGHSQISNNGIVTQDLYSDIVGDVVATLSKGAASETKTFTITVLQEDTAQTVANDKDYLVNNPYNGILNGNPDEDHIVLDLDFPVSGPSGSDITWDATAHSQITDAGAVTRNPSSNITADVIATLTRGGSSDTVVYTFTVLADNDAGAVAFAKASLHADDILGANLNLDYVMTDLNFPTTGDYDAGVVSISWSTDSAAIDSSGVVTQPPAGTGNETVNITATITKGAASDTLLFVATVIEEGGGEGGGESLPPR